MDWIQIGTFVFSVVAISATNIGLFLWARSESRADYRHLESSTTSILQGIRDDMRQFHEEMKGFNCRICRIQNKDKP